MDALHPRAKKIIQFVYEVLNINTLWNMKVIFIKYLNKPNDIKKISIERKTPHPGYHNMSRCTWPIGICLYNF